MLDYVKKYGALILLVSVALYLLWKYFLSGLFSGVLNWVRGFWNKAIIQPLATAQSWHADRVDYFDKNPDKQGYQKDVKLSETPIGRFWSWMTSPITGDKKP